MSSKREESDGPVKRRVPTPEKTQPPGATDSQEVQDLNRSLWRIFTGKGTNKDLEYVQARYNSLARRYARDVDRADILQIAFKLALQKGRHAIRIKKSWLAAWFGSIVRGAAQNESRKRARHDRRFTSLEVEPSGTDNRKYEDCAAEEIGLVGAFVTYVEQTNPDRARKYEDLLYFRFRVRFGGELRESVTFDGEDKQKLESVAVSLGLDGKNPANAASQQYSRFVKAFSDWRRKQLRGY